MLVLVLLSFFFKKSKKTSVTESDQFFKRDLPEVTGKTTGLPLELINYSRVNPGVGESF
jgi:hypothetical protein